MRLGESASLSYYEELLTEELSTGTPEEGARLEVRKAFIELELERTKAYASRGYHDVAGWGRGELRWERVEARSRREHLEGAAVALVGELSAEGVEAEHVGGGRRLVLAQLRENGRAQPQTIHGPRRARSVR